MFLTVFLKEKENNISYFELILLSYVESFKNGCYRRTEDIAKDLKTNITTIRKSIKHLIELKKLFRYKTKGKHYVLFRHEKKNIEEENKKFIEETNDIIEKLKQKWKKQ